MFLVDIILPVILTTGVVNLSRAVLAGAPTTQDSGFYGSTKIRSSNTRQRRRANASFTQTRDFDFPILLAVETTVEAIAEHPLQFPVVYRSRRRAGVWRFPYAIFFEAQEHRIVVIAFFHGRRNSKRWQLR
jgi:hypothetical protein